MTLQEEIEHWAYRWPGLNIKSILPVLLGLYRDESTPYVVDDVILESGASRAGVYNALMLLRGAPSNMVRSEFMFKDDGDYHYMSDKEVSEIMCSGSGMLHPVDGRVIKDPEKHIFVWFYPGPWIIERAAPAAGRQACSALVGA